MRPTQLFVSIFRFSYQSNIDEVVVLHAVLDEGFMSALHIFTTPTEDALPEDAVSFTVNPKNRYMFAFLSKTGAVTI